MLDCLSVGAQVELEAAVEASEERVRRAEEEREAAKARMTEGEAKADAVTTPAFMSIVWPLNSLNNIEPAHMFYLVVNNTSIIEHMPVMHASLPCVPYGPP